MSKGSFNGLAAGLAAASLFFSSSAFGVNIVWQKQEGKDVIVLQGVEAKHLDTKWTDAEWRKVFPVAVETGDLVSSMELPPMLGRYQVKEGTVIFTPEYPLTAGLKYRATVNPSKLPGYSGKPALVTSTHAVASVKVTPTTAITQVYPSADVLPENLLKFYLHFSAPMNGGHIYEHIRLLNSAGRPVELPFLEIDEELWNPEMTRLTLFIDPGRIKREVKPLEDIGPALEAGKTYTLVIDKAWQDGKGAPMKATFRKEFKVSAPDRTPPDPKTWKIETPAAGSVQPLIIEFPKSMDHALSQRMMQVVSADKKLVAGNVTLENYERRWLFTPEKSWSAGSYQLQVQTTIEDLAGNNIGKPFEVDLFEGVEKRIKNEAVNISFEIKSAR